MRDRWDLVVVTNDIYTKEDQRLLTVAGALEAERIMGVETGGCPHTAIREDASINLEAVDRMLEKFPDADAQRRQPAAAAADRVQGRGGGVVHAPIIDAARVGSPIAWVRGPSTVRPGRPPRHLPEDTR